MKPRPRQSPAGTARERSRCKTGIEKPCSDGAGPFKSGKGDQQDSEFPWLKLHARVEHKAFGLGTVLSFTGTGSMRTATFLFDVHGERTMLLAFANVNLKASHA